MRFTPLPIDGAFLIVLEPIRDERGYFARTWCADEFARHGLDSRAAQANLGVNPRRGTLRGLHFQAAPHLEAKLVRCLRGSAWDVLVDLRPESTTFRRWHAVELSAENHHAVYIPPLCAHGYVTLVDDTEVWYQATTPYAPSAAGGVRHDDPAIGIEWPIEATVISERDQAWPLLSPTA